jgi:hypothetical protein
MYNIVSWDGVMHLVFGDKSPIADKFSDMQRKADNAREDGVQEAMQEIDDLFTHINSSADRLRTYVDDATRHAVTLRPRGCRRARCSWMPVIIAVPPICLMVLFWW